jgi:hypothetical protein
MTGFTASQKGFVLLLCLVLISGIGITTFILIWNNSRALKDREKTTERALKQAKDTLISHALIYGEIHRTNAAPSRGAVADSITLPPGMLPCPEKTLLNANSEGAQSGHVTAVTFHLWAASPGARSVQAHFGTPMANACGTRFPVHSRPIRRPES